MCNVFNHLMLVENTRITNNLFLKKKKKRHTEIKIIKIYFQKIHLQLLTIILVNFFFSLRVM